MFHDSTNVKISCTETAGFSMGSTMRLKVKNSPEPSTRAASTISKKELLEQYQISYGALYRWKRMGLIPEGWFLRRSAPTGQETYFRRAQICPRIELILQSKDRVSLEALAAELQGQKQAAAAERMLILETKYGLKTFY